VSFSECRSTRTYLALLRPFFPSRLPHMKTYTVDLAPELLDLIVGNLHHFPTGLKSCALISQAWVYSAQSHLFSNLYLQHFKETQLEQLLDKVHATLHASPHLLRHVRSLDMLAPLTLSDPFIAICRLGFTLLHTAVITFDTTKWSQSVLGVQELLSLTTLRDVSMKFQFRGPEDFLPIWERCSAGIEHLALTCSTATPSLFPPLPPHSSPQSRLVYMEVEADREVLDWLADPMSPFNFSELKALSMNHWLVHHNGLRIFGDTLEVMDFDVRMLFAVFVPAHSFQGKATAARPLVVSTPRQHLAYDPGGAAIKAHADNKAHAHHYGVRYRLTADSQGAD
jgi:hypothetical protein